MGRKATIALAILLFLGAAWGGAWVRRVQGGQTQLAQPGWCCMPSVGECVAVADAQSCRAQGGSTFNWDSEICTSFCQR
jgi:hypothetical protein